MNTTATPTVSFIDMTDAWQPRYLVITTPDQTSVVDLYGDDANRVADLPEVDVDEVPTHFFSDYGYEEAILQYRRQLARMEAQQECDRLNRADSSLREHIDNWIDRNITDCGDDLVKLSNLKWEGIYLQGTHYIFDGFGYKVSELPSHAASRLIEAYAATRFAQHWTRLVAAG